MIAEPADGNERESVTPSTPPRWQLASIYRDLGSDEYEADLERLIELEKSFTAFADERGIDAGPSLPVCTETVKDFVEVVDRINTLLPLRDKISIYLSALMWEDASNETAASEYLRFRRATAGIPLLVLRSRSWFARFDSTRLMDTCPTAAQHAYALHTSAVQAAHRLSSEEELLYTALRGVSSSAWQRLYQEMASAANAESQRAATTAAPVSSQSPQSSRGGARYESHRKDVAAWSDVAIPISAAFNAVKGEALVMAARRRWTSPLAERLADEGIEAKALQAMQESIRGAIPDFQHFLKTKAQFFGYSNGLPLWDYSRPLPTADEFTWSKALSVVERSFAVHDSQLAGLVPLAISERWVDAEKRPGKRRTGLCAQMSAREFRILVEFDGSIDAIRRLAHEFGHAYHFLRISGHTWLQRDIPMTLAETASTVCESLVVEELIGTGTLGDQLAVLDAALTSKCQMLFDTLSTFQFEQDVFEQYRRGPLTPKELCGASLRRQREVYGTAIDLDTLHPYAWAARPHNFQSPYVNWQYAFGLLLGTGMRQNTMERGEDFFDVLTPMLDATGKQSVTALSAHAGIDITDPSFWSEALHVVQDEIHRFTLLAQEWSGRDESNAEFRN